MEGEEADGLLSWPLVARIPFFFLLLLLFRLFGGGGLSSGAGAGAAGGVSGLGGTASSSIEYGMVLALSSDENISASYKRIRNITIQLAHARAVKATHQICAVYMYIYIYIYIHAYSDTLGIHRQLIVRKSNHVKL